MFTAFSPGLRFVSGAWLARHDGVDALGDQHFGVTIRSGDQVAADEIAHLRALNGEMVEALRSLHSVAERYCDAVDGWAEDIGGEDPNKVLRELGPETMRARAILAKMENEDE